MDPQRIVGYFGVTEGMKVADFGSGSGYFAILVAKMIGENGVLTAVDVLESAFETLRAKAKAEGLKNIETVRGNLEVKGGSGLNNDSQDLVLLVNILFESDKKAEIIAEARRVLKTGSALVFADWKKGTGGFGPPDSSRIDPEEMRELFISSGFEFVSPIDAGTFHDGTIFRKS